MGQTIKHLQKYLDKSGDDKIFTSNLVENKHGFASYAIDGEILSIINVFGDGSYWESFFADLATKSGCKRMRFHTMRNPKGFEKKYDFKIIGYLLEKEVQHG